MRILIITDAWHPQINGVVRTLDALSGELRRRGHEVHMVTPQDYEGWPIPFYPEIKLSQVSVAEMSRRITVIAPDFIQISTEGPLGWIARWACLNLGLTFTTAFHTRFAEYVESRIPLPGVAALGWAVLRRFHRPSANILVPTKSISVELENRGFKNIRIWSRGVDRQQFQPWPRDHFPGLARPILLYAGRLAIEKGIADFLNCKTTGTKVVIGDGPARAGLQQLHPDAVFTGYRHGEDYARSLASADVLVFPSRTDTFGLVMLEAMACGTPVAAYPVAGPIDVVSEGKSGNLHEDIDMAISAALQRDREEVLQASKAFSWEHTTDLFEECLVPAGDGQKSGQLYSAHGELLHLR